MNKIKEIRAKECHFNLRVQKENVADGRDTSIQKMIKRHSVMENHNDQLVSDSLRKQDDLLQKKIEERSHKYVISIYHLFL